MNEMFKTEKQDDIMVVTLTLGSFTHGDNDRLMKDFDVLLNVGNKKMVLDLSETDYMSSLILASLVYMQKRARDAGGDLVMCGIKNKVQEIISVTNLDKIFNIVSDRKTALEQFSKK